MSDVNETQPVNGAREEEPSFESLLAAYEDRTQTFSEGEVIRGKVIAVTGTSVIVDVGFKSEGIIPLEQFLDEHGEVSVQVGDVVDVFLEQTEDSRGHVVLSREKAERMKIWDEIERAYREGNVVKGRVIERIKGGLAVDIGVRAFLPGSQIDVRPVRNLDSLRGEEFEMRVIKVNKKRGNIVLSRKAVLEESLKEERAKTLEILENGKIMDGVVKNITDYGAFIDLGGVDGLLHITDMSWGRVNHPSELFNVGDNVTVKVIKFTREDGRVSLGYKQLSQDPWLAADMRYPKNLRVPGKVVSLTDYGAFIELEPGVEGLIHISEMTWNKRVKHPSKILNVGDEVETVVLDIDVDSRRISLGLKQTEPNPWDVIETQYSPGDVITGKVRNITDFGAFVEVEEGIDGLVHVSDISWTKRVKHPSEVLKKGDDVQAVILSIDAPNQKLSLGIKQLEPDHWEDWFSRHKVGDIVNGRVVRMTNFGAFMELEEGIEGLCHVSELDEKHVERPTEFLNIGQEIEMRIIKLSLQEKKIGLSLKAMKEDEPRVEFSSYMASADSGNASMGERLGEQLQRFKKTEPETEPEEE
ncbi:MAG: 30S ribosomal protein S1 [Acidobacteriota bacterium]|jgi:small subunit ribosomal protein S1|nr:30S ribosomal protein S1 [Acidobacteriota bacterium]NLT32081.1 30S ribosomal protein S1 [Acidobacteriota bacterium]